MKNIIIAVIVACFILMPGFNQPEASSIPNEVSVKLKYHLKGKSEISLNFVGSYQLVGDSSFLLSMDNDYLVKVNNQQIDLYENSRKIKSFTGPFEIKPVKYGEDNHIRVQGRPYLGNIKFTLENNNVVPINTLPMEDYLKGVLPSEVFPSWNVEALKAQAVAARTYALKRVNQVITDDVGSQRYDGYIWLNKTSYKNTNEAVNATKGQVLTYKGNLIDAVFSSNNGGYIESNKGAWPGGTQLDYLKAKADPYDPAFPWSLKMNQKQIDLEELNMEKPAEWWNVTKESGLKDTTEAKVINNIKTYLKTKIPALKDLEIKLTSIDNIAVSDSLTPGQRRTQGSYSIKYLLKNKDGSFVMEEEKIKLHSFHASDTAISNLRTMFGINEFKSHFIESITLKDAVFEIKGKGWGHGVGMSQYGAKAMADSGLSYNEILSFYYENTNYENYIFNQINTSLRGSDRYETSVRIAEYGWKNGFQTVVIGRGDNPVDALTGSVLAKKQNAPLLLVKTDEIPASVQTLLQSVTIEEILVLGGTSAISEKTFNNLQNYSTKVTRISGSDRYDTSVDVAGQLQPKGEVILTSGSSTSPDALSIASYAALNQIPILFTRNDALPNSVQKYLIDHNIEKVTIIGGTQAVSENVKIKLETLTEEVKRVRGTDRYATSVAIVNEYDLDPRNLFFARGEEFIDALPGSVLAAKMEAPLLLTKKDSLPNEVSGFINENIHYIPQIHYLGGTGAISEYTRNMIQQSILD
ncbi:MAG: SpoIID/LytB domain-containing protein [Bacillota bacterium]